MKSDEERKRRDYKEFIIIDVVRIEGFLSTAASTKELIANVRCKDQRSVDSAVNDDNSFMRSENALACIGAVCHF